MDYTNIGSSVPSGALSESVRKTLTNTFIAVGAMLAITAVAAGLSLGLKLGFMGSIIALVASIAIIFGISAFKDSPLGLVLLAVFAGIQGVTLGPVLNVHLAVQGGSQIVMQAAGLTALATFLCAGYTITTRKDFSRIRMFLLVGTILLLVASIASIFIPSAAFSMMISAVGCLIFLGWMLHDISAVVVGHQKNYIVAALGIFLDILNFFIFMLRLLSGNKSSE